MLPLQAERRTCKTPLRDSPPDCFPSRLDGPRIATHRQEERIMNKLAAFLLFATCLCFASIASAAVQEFGPDFHRFTIDVPQDWTAVAVNGGAHVTSVDQTCSLGVVIDRNYGQSAEAICKAIVAQTGIANAREMKKDADTYAIEGTKDGVSLYLSVTVDGDEFYCFTIGGDKERSKPILQSMNDKK